ncbi:MAG: YfhO family protein [Candidatus Latescibacteria bacterium]|nr:YfhO family protein [Candidatus Latescibacterota bacterium]
MAKHKGKGQAQKPVKSSQTLARIFEQKRTYLILLAVLLFIFFLEIIFKRGFFWEDFLEQNFPYRLFAARALADGIFPYWNPYIFGGLPFFADVQTGVLFPLNLILTVFVSGRWLSSYAVELFMILHLLIAGIGMFYFSLENRLSKTTAFFTGLVYMLNGHFIVHITHTQQVQTFVLIPFIFLFLQKGLRDSGIRSFVSIVVCGLLLGFAGLAGYPQAIVIILTGVFLYFIYQLIITPKRFGHLLLSFIVIFLIMGLIVACQYIPTYLLFKSTLRAEYPYAEIVKGSFHPLRFITFLIPNYFGSTSQGNLANYFGPDEYYQYWEQMAYFGVIPLILAGFAFYKSSRKQTVLPMLLILIPLFIGLGKFFPLHILLYKFVPFFKDIRTPAKFLNMTIFGAVWLAGIGLDNILHLKPKARKIALTGIVLGIIMIILYFFLPHNIAAAAKSIATRNIFISVITVLLGVFFIRAHLNNKMSKPLFSLLIIGLAFFDLFIFGFKYNSGNINPEIYWQENRAVQFFKNENKQELARVNIRAKEGLILPRNIGYVQEFSTTDGYNPLSLERYMTAMQKLDRDRFFTLMNVKYATVFDSLRRQVTIAKREKYLPRAGLYYDWEVIKDREQILDKLNQQDFPYEQRVILEDDILISPIIDLTAAAGSVKIIDYALNRIKLEAEVQSDAILVLSENYYPNWYVKINGEINPSIPVNYFLRGAVVKAGNNQVEFFYKERYFSVLLMIGIATILLSIIFIVLCNLFKKPKSNI